VEILDAALRESLTATIRAAIQAHLEMLPPEQRAKPPRPPESRKPDDRLGEADAKPQNAPVHAKPARIILPPAPIRAKSLQAATTKPVAEKPKLPPPPRLLANFSRRP